MVFPCCVLTRKNLEHLGYTGRRATTALYMTGSQMEQLGSIVSALGITHHLRTIVVDKSRDDCVKDLGRHSSALEFIDDNAGVSWTLHLSPWEASPEFNSQYFYKRSCHASTTAVQADTQGPCARQDRYA